MKCLTSAVLGVKVLVDGVERVLLFTAMFLGPQDVPDTLVQEGVLALQHRTHRDKVRSDDNSGPAQLWSTVLYVQHVPPSGPCVGGEAGGRTHSRTGRWFLWSPTAAEPDPKR